MQLIRLNKQSTNWNKRKTTFCYFLFNSHKNKESPDYVFLRQNKARLLSLSVFITENIFLQSTKRARLVFCRSNVIELKICFLFFALIISGSDQRHFTVREQNFCKAIIAGYPTISTARSYVTEKWTLLKSSGL